MVSNETVRISYAGNNSTSTPYVVPFLFLSNADVVVVTRTSGGVETTLTEGVGYTLTGAGVESGGSFTTASAVPVDSTVIIYRRTVAKQLSDYVEADSFPSASHEQGLDKLTLLVQECRDVLARCFRVGDTKAAIGGTSGDVTNDSLIGIDVSGMMVFRTATEVMTWLNLAATVFNMPTKTWANNAERATAVPDFIGQIGIQRDTFATYMGTATSAGSWTLTSAGTPADGSITTAKLADGVLSADSTGRAKMADGFLTSAKLISTFISGLTAQTLMADADVLLGFDGSAFKKFAGNVIVPPGSIIQIVSGEYTSSSNITSSIPGDDSIPQVGEGTQIISAAITPRFNDSLVFVFFSGAVAVSGTTIGASAAIFRNGASNAIASQYHVSADGDAPIPFCIQFHDSPASVSAQTYTVRVGPTSGTLRLNGVSSARRHGGAQRAVLTLMEIKV